MDPEPRKILVVDDDILILLALARAYRRRSHDLITAASAGHALTQMEKTRFDLFVINIDLLDQSSYELVTQIDERCPYIPMIITTADEGDFTEASKEISNRRKKGTWHLLEKPYHLDLLNSLIETSLTPRADHPYTNQARSYGPFTHARSHQRKPHILQTKLSYEEISAGEIVRHSMDVILTDISDGGVGLLTNRPLEESQVVRFEDSLEGRSGVVSWSLPMAEQTCRAGIHFC